MSRDEQERLRDIKGAIATIRRHLEQAGETAAAKEDPLLHDALLFQFVVIGEAVKHLPLETRESAPEIPLDRHRRTPRLNRPRVLQGQHPSRPRDRRAGSSATRKGHQSLGLRDRLQRVQRDPPPAIPRRKSKRSQLPLHGDRLASVSRRGRPNTHRTDFDRRLSG